MPDPTTPLPPAHAARVLRLLDREVVNFWSDSDVGMGSRLRRAEFHRSTEMSAEERSRYEAASTSAGYEWPAAVLGRRRPRASRWAPRPVRGWDEAEVWGDDRLYTLHVDGHELVFANNLADLRVLAPVVRELLGLCHGSKRTTVVLLHAVAAASSGWREGAGLWWGSPAANAAALVVELRTWPDALRSLLVSLVEADARGFTLAEVRTLPDLSDEQVRTARALVEDGLSLSDAAEVAVALSDDEDHEPVGLDL